jgi:phage tail-like protein
VEAEMAVFRDRPYGRFNFLVDLGTGETDGPEAGFLECGPIASSLSVAEYRNGNEKENSPRKLTGLERVDDVTLRRGIIGSLNLYQWYNQVRNGDVTAFRTVTISLQNEDHTAIVMVWKLLRARPIKYVSGPMNAKTSEVAIEELTLAYERLEIE